MLNIADEIYNQHHSGKILEIKIFDLVYFLLSYRTISFSIKVKLLATIIIIKDVDNSSQMF
jgi:hypothetical protein